VSTAALQNDEFQTRFMTHLIDAASMKSDIENLKRTDHEFNTRIISALDSVTSELKGLREMIGFVPGQIAACRIDMRNEIERDFPNKMDAMSMERRIEDKLAETDKTLGLQIAAVGKKSSDDIQSLKDQITCVENKVDRQWLKITVIVSTIVAIGGFAQWLLMFYSSL
jgi:hypothetical protein